MQCDLSWLASVTASGLHAAAVNDRGIPLTDARMANALVAPAAELSSLLSSAEIPRPAFWRHAIPLSRTIDTNHELAEVVLRKTLGSARLTPALVRMLTASFDDIQKAVRKAFPDLLDQLSMRAKPLREQWEAHGPGLLTLISQQIEEQLIVPRAWVLLVHPALGGDGQAHLDYNSVTIEAVLADPNAGLPEVLRLAWMLAQLNNDLPIHSEMIPGQMLPLVSQLAMLPPTLAAAEQLELARHDAETIELAIRAWRIAAAKDMDAIGIVTSWWETYGATQPAWRVALSALSQMLGGP